MRSTRFDAAPAKGISTATYSPPDWARSPDTDLEVGE